MTQNQQSKKIGIALLIIIKLVHSHCQSIY